MEITGIIELIKPEQVITESFKKREFVITTFDEYPQSVILEVVNKLCVILDNYNIGETVSIKINLRGRKWTNPEGVDKYFNTVQAWAIEKVPTGEPEEEEKEQGNIERRFEDEAIDNMTEEDDLPF